MTTDKMVNAETGELVEAGETFVRETDEYVIKRNQEGLFIKERKYQRIWSHQPETTEEQVMLYQVFNSKDDDDSDNVTPMKNMVKKVIGIDQYYLNPYKTFDEKTGLDTHGVTVTIKDGDHFYATSSKTVYHDILGLVQAFGEPNSTNYKKIFVKVTGTKRDNGVQIGLSLSHIGEK